MVVPLPRTGLGLRGILPGLGCGSVTKIVVLMVHSAGWWGMRRQQNNHVMQVAGPDSAMAVLCDVS